MNATYALVLLRVFVGVIFFFALSPKVAAGSAYQDQLRGFLTNYAMNNAHPFYREFLSSTVLPNVALFSKLVVVGEAFVAIAMVTGTVTRLAGVVAMFLLVNYMFAKGLWWWNPSSNDSAFFMIALALVIGAAGRTAGVDAVLARRWPNVVLW
jgi:uncharacterized membrane protein YphA (DoxX/SURF4 family)